MREFDKRSKHFLLGDYFINSHNQLSWLCIDYCWEKLMFVTFETWRVKHISCTCTVLHHSLFSCHAIVLNILLLLILFYLSIPLRRYVPEWSIPSYNNRTLMPNWCSLSLRTKWQTLPCGEVLKSLHHSNWHSFYSAQIIFVLVCLAELCRIVGCRRVSLCRWFVSVMASYYNKPISFLIPKSETRAVS